MNKLSILVLSTILSAYSYSATISMAFGEKIPPYCFPETNSGIEIEIIREALAFKGHILQPKYYSFARVPYAFKTKQVDATMTDLGEDLTPYGGVYAQPAVIYHNVLITLQERQLKINKPEDLAPLSVVSFQGANKRYPSWLKAVQERKGYFELADQKLQVLTLNAGRYDVVLSDRSIFRYYTLLLQKEKNFKPKAVQEHEFVKLNPNDYRPIFRDPAIRDDFNIGLEHLKKTGRYQAIYDQYLKKLAAP